MNWQIINRENLSLFNPQIVRLSFWAFNNFLVSLSSDPLIFVCTSLSDLYISRLFVIIRIKLFLNKYITLCRTLDIKKVFKSITLWDFVPSLLFYLLLAEICTLLPSKKPFKRYKKS